MISRNFWGPIRNGYGNKKYKYLIYSLGISFGPADGPDDEGLTILLVNSEASWESDMTEWFESSPIALIGVSDLKNNIKWLPNNNIFYGIFYWLISYPRLCGLLEAALLCSVLVIKDEAAVFNRFRSEAVKGTHFKIFMVVSGMVTQFFSHLRTWKKYIQYHNIVKMQQKLSKNTMKQN